MSRIRWKYRWLWSAAWRAPWIRFRSGPSLAFRRSGVARAVPRTLPMQRDLNRLANERFALLVIGGGITGACIARDAALRGLAVALVEKNDFANATSAHNSKLIHGGLRYLRNFELGLVRESLRERRIWQRIAPHLVQPLPFLVPLYGGGWQARATLSAGLTLYDLLSFDRGWQGGPAAPPPRHPR